MKKLLKITGISVGLIVVLAIVAIVIATMVIDTNEYRDKISTLVKEQTGRDLTIKGDLSLSFFPWVGLSIGDTTLSNAKGFGSEPFARFQQIDVKVKVLPLFKKSVEVNTVVLDGMVLNLAKNKQGVSNWDDLIKASKESKPEKTDKDDKSEGMGMSSLKIGGVNIKDAQLSWQDAQSGASYAITDFQFKTGAINPAEPIDLNLGFNLKDQKAKKSWRFGMSGGLTMDMEKHSAHLSKLVLELANIRLRGDIQVNQMMSTPVVIAKLKSDEFVPRDTFKDMGIALPKTSDATVFGKAMLELAVNASADKVDVSQLLVRMDETSLKGTASVKNFNKPAIRFSMDVDQIDVDRYLPPVSDQPQKKAASDAVADDRIILPVEMLRDLDLKGDFKIGKMKAANLRSEAISTTLTAKGGVLRAYPSSAKMYEGSYAGDITLDVRGKELAVAMNEKLSGIQASPLFKDLADMDWIGGKGDMTANLKGRGNTMTGLRSSLQGNIAMSFLDGKIKGVNIPYKIRQAYALLKRLPAPAAEPNETRFTSIKATATVKDGVVDNRDMSMDTPVLNITGEGTADLGKEEMNYVVKATVNDKLADTAGEAMTKLKGRTIPVRIKGPFNKLNYNIALEDAVKEQVKEKVKEKVEEKVKEKLNDKIGDKLKDKFKGLF